LILAKQNYKISILAKKQQCYIDFAPYSLIPITSFSDIEGVLVSYQNGPIAQKVSAELILVLLLPKEITSNCY
jgi:hypothetical protein